MKKQNANAVDVQIRHSIAKKMHVEPTLENIISKMTMRTRQFPKLLETIGTELANIDRKMKSLKKQGLIYAKPHYRRARYLVLVYRQERGVRPLPQYVGSDEKKIAEALAGIDRANQYDVLTHRRDNLMIELLEAEKLIGDIERVLALP